MMKAFLLNCETYINIPHVLVDIKLHQAIYWVSLSHLAKENAFVPQVPLLIFLAVLHSFCLSHLSMSVKANVVQLSSH